MATGTTLYEADLLLWAEQQAEALARLRSRVRDNDIDWEHLIEEVRDLGLSELRACIGNLRLALLHLLKLARWPDHPATCIGPARPSSSWSPHRRISGPR
ncbi:MAG: DUF29 domain-containing protein [Bacteroidales bacterium]|nr:DUF29 domain-containing protein [Bacteroidales bacterium]